MERQFYSRKLKKLKTEFDKDAKKLEFLYSSVLGRVLLKLIFQNAWFSRISGIYYNSVFSKRALIKFVSQHKLPYTLNEINKFKSFNAFFTRKEQHAFNCLPLSLISPAQAYLSVYTINNALSIYIKGRKYSIKQLLKNTYDSTVFANGTCLVYRLTLTDYHRYINSHSGKIIKTAYIKGVLNTVRPIKNSNHNYFENSREITIIETENADVTAQIEVGAMLVGKIVNHKTTGQLARFEEKGFFELGGSTIIQLYKKGTVFIDNDILNYSKQNIETKVLIGETVGYVKAIKHIF